MLLTLDNQHIELVENEDTPLRDVIERISLQLKEKHRVISEIFVDGMQIAGWDDPDVAERTVGTCKSMRLVSEEPRKLAHQVLYDIASYMPKIQEALVDSSSKIQSRNEQEGLQVLEQATSAWAELLQGLQSALTVTGLNFEDVRVGDKSFIEINEDIHTYLEEASGLVEEQRYLELSDILEYEIAPRIPHMEEGIYQLIKMLEKKTH